MGGACCYGVGNKVPVREHDTLWITCCAGGIYDGDHIRRLDGIHHCGQLRHILFHAASSGFNDVIYSLNPFARSNVKTALIAGIFSIIGDILLYICLLPTMTALTSECSSI